MDYLMLGKVEFEFFVMSVLRQIAARNRQEITFGKIISAYTENKASDKYLKFDAVAPNGFGDFKGCIYFEFKKLQKRSSTEAKSIESFRRKTLIISKKPGNTGKSRDKDTEFTTHLLHSEGALTRCPFP